jgi:hypothetical protein
VAYGDGLENRCWCKPTVGSNPTPSAILKLKSKKKPPNGCSNSRGFSIFANKLLTEILAVQ